MNGNYSLRKQTDFKKRKGNGKMKAKIYKMAVSGILISFLLVNFGCKKNSSTGNDNSQISGNGSDYFPLTGNEIYAGRATYQFTTYDSTGKPVENQTAAGQEVKGYTGNAQIAAGLQVYPLYYYGKDTITSESAGIALAQSNQSLIAMEVWTSWTGQLTTSGQFVTLLPADIAMGTQWVANPSSPLREQVTLKITESKSTYTNSAGETYSNVIGVSASYSDSTTSSDSNSWYDYAGNYWSSHSAEFTSLKSNGEVYFAKGVGIVDVKINQLESVDKWTEVDSEYFYNTYPYRPRLPWDTVYSSYSRVVGSGSCGRTDSPSGSIAQKGAQNSLRGVKVEKAPKKINLLDLLFGNRKAFQRGRYMKH